jgi:predicted transcriptional regulator
MNDETTQTDVVELATELTIAWLSNPNTRANASEIPDFLRAMHQAVAGLSEPAQSAEQPEAKAEHVPAVSVRKSLASKDHLISLVDGKPYKSLRRHLTKHGMTPDDYRERYGLKSDYPMVAPTYADQRREMAKKIGLGRKPKPSADEGEQAPQPKQTRRRAAKAS